MKDTFVKQNDEPIEIVYHVDRSCENLTIKPSFVWNGCRYYLDQFMRCHDNPCILDTFPDYIHAMLYEQYYNPLFLEFVGGDYVNIYQ